MTEFGVVCDWPTHIPMPAGYPPWGADPVEWREANQPGWYLPEPSDYVTIPPKLADGLVTLGALFGVTPPQFVELLQEVSGDSTKAFGLTNNGTRAFDSEREGAFSGQELSVALILLCLGPGGSGKSQTAVRMMWRDHLARHRAGYMRRHGWTPSDKFWRFGPWNFCCDLIDYNENRTKYPDHSATVLDDSLSHLDAEGIDLRKSALAGISDLFTKERSRGRTGAVTNVLNVDFDLQVFSDVLWHWAYMRVPSSGPPGSERFGYTVRMTRRSTDSFKFKEFLLPIFPALDIGGDLAACPGGEMLTLFGRIKLDAHARLYSGKAVSKYALMADALLAANPADAVDNCFTQGMMLTWINPLLSAEYGAVEGAVEWVFRQLWSAFRHTGYTPYRGRKTDGRWALVDRNNDVAFVIGEPSEPGLLEEFIHKWRSRLPLPKDRFLAPVQVRASARAVA